MFNLFVRESFLKGTDLNRSRRVASIRAKYAELRALRLVDQAVKAAQKR